MISVIIPVYNVEDYLHVCINSVLKQTYQNFEIICIDDASTDSSSEILDYFHRKDSRIKILKNDQNMGPGYSRNQGLKIAKGKYISFLDGDDWLSLDSFEKLVKQAENRKLDVLIFKNMFYSEDLKEFILDNSDINFIDNFKSKVFNHFDLNKEELFSICNSSCNKLYLKSFLEKNNIKFTNKNLIHENYLFFFKVITSARRISVIDEYFYNKRNHNAAITNSKYERIFDDIEICNLILKIFLSNIQLYEYYKKELFNYLFVDFLYNKYRQSNLIYKKNFYKEIQNIYRNFIKYYDLYEDIESCIDSNILKEFKLQEIIKIIKNPPKISIIVPVYNTEKELPNLLESIINQTIGFSNLEVIVIDDGSDDGSRNIIKKYSRKYKNIVPIFLNENTSSPSKPRNIGIRYANSDYIIFQDSDDTFEWDACEWLYNCISEENSDIVGGMCNINNNGNKYVLNYDYMLPVLKQDNVDMGIIESKELFKYRLNTIDDNFLMLKDPNLKTKIIKKSLLFKENIYFPEDINGGEDAVVLFHALIKANGITFINKTICNYDMMRENSLTHNYSMKTIKNRPKAYKMMLDIAIENNMKKYFVENLLWRKLNYWIHSHLIKSNEIIKEDIVSIFKSNKILFEECIEFNCNLPDFFKSLCSDITNDKFEDAANKIMNLMDN